IRSYRLALPNVERLLCGMQDQPKKDVGTTDLQLLLWRPATLDRSAASWRSTLRPTCRRRSARAAPAASTEACIWQPVEVVRPIANRISFCIQELRRLLKNQRRRHAFG